MILVMLFYGPFLLVAWRAIGSVVNPGLWAETPLGDIRGARRFHTHSHIAAASSRSMASVKPISIAQLTFWAPLPCH